jgi:hypothetical protein
MTRVGAGRGGEGKFSTSFKPESAGNCSLKMHLLVLLCKLEFKGSGSGGFQF